MAPAALRCLGPFAVVLALLFAQSLGALHRVAHHGSGPWRGGPAVAAEAAWAARPDGAQPGPGRLLPRHDGADECAAFDQACGGSALAPQGPPAAPSAVAGVAPQPGGEPSDAIARPRSFFARAPPTRPGAI